MLAAIRLKAVARAITVATFVLVTPLAAQSLSQLTQGMTPDQIAQLLQQRPDLAAALRQRLLASGQSAEDIRSQLQAAGYPSDLLDAYLGATDTTATITPQMVSAISLLRVGAFSLPDSLLLGADTARLRMQRDSARLAAIERADSMAEASGPLRLFGLNTFRQPTTQFQPMVTGPVDDSYVLGPGDVLVLILTGGVDLTRQLDVTRDGFILIPQVGQIYVGNLTLGQLRNVLYDQLHRVYSGVTRSPDARTKFDVTVAKVRQINVRVAGEVALPGAYLVAAAHSVLTALYDAGGPTPLGNFRDVQIRRGDSLIGSVDLYDYLIRGTLGPTPPLASGDVIFVPVRGARVKVAGAVRRPAIYGVKPGEGVREAIELAGGLSADASPQAATVARTVAPSAGSGEGPTRTVLTVDLTTALQPTAPPVALMDGDSITVAALTVTSRAAVSIMGSVWQPGTYQVTPGMTLWDLIQAAGGLRPGTYSGRVQILRTSTDSTRQMIGVALPADGKTPPAENPVLEARDRVTVYARPDFQPTRTISVYGAVRHPGTFTFADSMSMRDAILLAGGVRDDASLLFAQVSRVEPNAGPGGDSLATILDVPLDSSYVVDRTGYIARPVGVSAAPAVYLHPYDNVYVRPRPGAYTQQLAYVGGEVTYPGYYPITSKHDRITDLVQRAGGLTPNAYAGGAQFFRSENGVGNVGIDLPRDLKDPSYRDNFLLAAGDSLYVPRYIPTVTVTGEVYSPTAVAYAPGKDAGYYVNAAGGFTRDADKGRTYVHQPNGSVTTDKRPEPGAVVTVPKKVRGQGGVSFLAIMGGLAQIVAAATTFVLVLKQ